MEISISKNKDFELYGIGMTVIVNILSVNNCRLFVYVIRFPKNTPSGYLGHFLLQIFNF